MQPTVLTPKFTIPRVGVNGNFQYQSAIDPTESIKEAWDPNRVFSSRGVHMFVAILQFLLDQGEYSI